MEQKIGYKVLRINRHSAIRSLCVGGLRYPKLKEMKPKKGCGPLCVFTSKEDARIFARIENYEHLIVVKCEYKESIHTNIWHNLSFSRVSLECLPFRTILADSVTCLE